MQLGIFAKTFRQPCLDGVLQGIVALGIRDIHFNLACVGLDTLPTELPESQCLEIRKSFSRRQLTMCGISGTFNSIHPDAALRRQLIDRACLLLERCSLLGTQLVTLCTGTRNPDDMWTGHPDNGDASAWKDLCVTLTQLLNGAERHRIILGIEPEQANVINSAQKARRLLDEFDSPCLKIVFDAANLLHAGNLSRMDFILQEAVDVLGSDIVMAHAKDFPAQEGGSAAAGKGLLNWDVYLRALASSGYDGPLVLHGLDQTEAPECVAFLSEQLADIPLGPEVYK